MQLAEKTVFRSGNTFPLIDGFMFLRPRTKRGAATLVCFQMTFASQHPATASTLNGFIDRFNEKTEFVMAGGRARIIADGKQPLALQIGSHAPRRLTIVMLYLTRNPQFGEQKLEKTAKDTAKGYYEAAAVWNQIWQFRVSVLTKIE